MEEMYGKANGWGSQAFLNHTSQATNASFGYCTVVWAADILSNIELSSGYI